MKNLTNRTKVVLTVLCYLGLILFMNSCKEDDTPPDCGCESETLDTVPSDNFPEVPIEEQTSGLLFYKTSENIDEFYDFYVDGYYDNRFWIFQGVEGCGNCRRHYIICSEELLGSEYDFLKTSNDSIEISFTGNRKRLCEGPIVLPADILYSEIKLTSIEQQ